MSIVVNEKTVTEESNNFQINGLYFLLKKRKMVMDVIQFSGSQCDIAGILIPFNVTVPCRKEFNRKSQID